MLVGMVFMVFVKLSLVTHMKNTKVGATWFQPRSLMNHSETMWCFGKGAPHGHSLVVMHISRGIRVKEAYDWVRYTWQGEPVGLYTCRKQLCTHVSRSAYCKLCTTSWEMPLLPMWAQQTASCQLPAIGVMWCDHRLTKYRLLMQLLPIAAYYSYIDRCDVGQEIIWHVGKIWEMIYLLAKYFSRTE